MEYNVSEPKTLKLEHAHLELALKEEESYVWKNLIRIEELKREKSREKVKHLRHCINIQCRKPM